MGVDVPRTRRSVGDLRAQKLCVDSFQFCVHLCVMLSWCNVGVIGHCLLFSDPLSLVGD